MYFSGKITNSVLNFLDQQGVPFEDLYDLTDLSFEFMQDPSSWLDADSVEQFLEATESRLAHKFPNEELMSLVGHASFNLKSWGVLDSVLRMMQKPQDIYLQPQRFLSYFVSPDVALHSLVSTSNSAKFDVVITSQEYPMITHYLSAALESLPQFIGKSLASVNWNHDKVVISWQETDSQQELIQKNSEEAFVHPQLLNSIVQSLEETQNELEKKNEELIKKEKENTRLKTDLDNYVKQLAIKSLAPVSTNVTHHNGALSSRSVQKIKSEVMKLNDYLLRAQQLVSLLVSQGKMDKQARQAMKKMGWEHVLDESPSTVKKVLLEIDHIQSHPQQEPTLHS